MQGAHIFKGSINIEVSKASQSAIKAVEEAGGTITTAYYNKLSLRVLLHPDKYEDDPLNIPRRALPDKKLMKYYLNPKNRGYLLTEDGKARLKVYMYMYTTAMNSFHLLITMKA